MEVYVFRRAHLHTDVELALSKSDEHSGSFSPIIYFAEGDDESLHTALLE